MSATVSIESDNNEYRQIIENMAKRFCQPCSLVTALINIISLFRFFLDKCPSINNDTKAFAVNVLLLPV